MCGKKSVHSYKGFYSSFEKSCLVAGQFVMLGCPSKWWQLEHRRKPQRVRKEALERAPPFFGCPDLSPAPGHVVLGWALALSGLYQAAGSAQALRSGSAPC